MGGNGPLFLDITDLTDDGGEQGLLGLAFDPQYQSNHFVYINYTNNNGDTRVARLTANPAHTSVDESTRRQLLSIDQPAGNHNGGRLVFTPNGRLITAQGDGGGSCDPGGRAQNLRSRHGKLLSLNPRSISSGWRIDAYGLRNPWGVSFDRQTNRMYIADVGQDRYEEINTMCADAARRHARELPLGRLGGPCRSGCWEQRPARQRHPDLPDLGLHPRPRLLGDRRLCLPQGTVLRFRCAAGTCSATSATAASGGSST